MHDNTDGVLVSYRGHKLTVDEFHAFVYGLLGHVMDRTDEMQAVIEAEPQYYLAGDGLRRAIKYFRS